MKTKLLLLAFGFCITIFKAQNVNIPNANFKAYLLSNSAINTNGDYQIQVTEAVAFTGTINCNNRAINDFTGIEAFTNIKIFYCASNQLTSLNVTKY